MIRGFAAPHRPPCDADAQVRAGGRAVAARARPRDLLPRTRYGAGPPPCPHPRIRHGDESGHVARQLAESQKFPWSPELFSSVPVDQRGRFGPPPESPSRMAAPGALGQRLSPCLLRPWRRVFARLTDSLSLWRRFVLRGFIQSAASSRPGSALWERNGFSHGIATLDQSPVRCRSNDYMNNIPFRDVRTPCHSDGENHRSAAISYPSGRRRRGNSTPSRRTLALWLIEGRRPDILLFQAGADPLRDDPIFSPGLDPKRTFNRGPARFLVREGAGHSRWPGCWRADMLAQMFKRSSGFTLTRRSHMPRSLTVPRHDPLSGPARRHGGSLSVMRYCLETTWPRISRPLIRARLKLRVFLIETKLPAGLRHSGSSRRASSRKVMRGNLEPAHECATAAADLAAIDQPGRAGVVEAVGRSEE